MDASGSLKRDSNGHVMVNGYRRLESDGNSCPKIYKRQPSHRIFVNRSLQFEKIKVMGFDMDYTLADYKSPEFETMGFDMVKEKMVDMGYPEAILDFEYDPTFPCRGLWFDKQYGNLLKVDVYGNILVGIHGFSFLKSHEIEKLYPNKYIALDENRVYVLNTLFNLPETYLIACLIDYFSNCKDYECSQTGVKNGDLFMSFRSIYQDLRKAVDYVHNVGPLKDETVRQKEKYVCRDARLPAFLDRARASGIKTLLITNSDFKYTKGVMTYLMDFPGYEDRDWKSFFDLVIVDAQKPNFFKDGTLLRRVDIDTGNLRLGHYVGALEQGCVYSGGCCDTISQMLGVKGKEILYVGDHIYGDIVRSKKEWGWRTFLIVPEMIHELKVWTEQKDYFDTIDSLEAEISEKYRDLDSNSKEKPNIRGIQKAMVDTVHKLDMSYGMLGSIFRSGSRLTFFSAQIQRYADIYAGNVLNLVHYPMTYMFRAPSMLMPHESTVEHDNTVNIDDDGSGWTKGRSVSVIEESGPKGKMPRMESLPHTKPYVPRKITHCHDEDDYEDESSNSPKSEPDS